MPRGNIIAKIFGVQNPEWTDLNLKEDLKKIYKFIYLSKIDNPSKKIFLSGTSSYIENHSDLVEYFEDLKLGNFNDYEIIGAGDMNNGSISHFNSYGFEVRTNKEIALEIYEFLGNPELGGKANYLLNN